MGAKTSFYLLKEVSSQTVPEEFTAAGFGISADEAGSIVESHSHEKLTAHGGVDGVVKKLKTSTIDGLDMDDKELTCRQQLFGTNEFTERKQRGFWVFVYEALQDLTLMVPALYAFVSLIVGIAKKKDGQPGLIMLLELRQASCW
ncbi:putative P-type Ca(2+) transporter [Helianthus anomalus]